MAHRIGWLDRTVTFASRWNVRGWHRLVRVLRGDEAFHLIKVRTAHGLILLLDPEDYLDSIVIREGYYEQEVLEGILAHLNAGDVLWDVGANIGLHSLTVKRLRPDAKVICFEASPFVFSRLFGNASLNEVDILPFNIALSDSAGYADLSLMLRGNCGLTSLQPWTGVVYHDQMRCRLERGSSMVEHHAVPPPTVIKVDVEGHELAVLKGMGTLLDLPHLKAIIFEMARDPARSIEEHPVPVFLYHRGFRVRALATGRPGPETNFIAVRGKTSAPTSDAM